jgi:hypothetical protein
MQLQKVCNHRLVRFRIDWREGSRRRRRVFVRRRDAEIWLASKRGDVADGRIVVSTTDTERSDISFALIRGRALGVTVRRVVEYWEKLLPAGGADQITLAQAASDSAGAWA